MIILGKRSKKMWGADLEVRFLGTIMRFDLLYVDNMCIIGK